MTKKYIHRYKLSYTQIYNLVGYQVMNSYHNGKITFDEFDQHLITAIQEHNKNVL
tara:strand:+ start:1025 stop:1189 length:165 start_codon:yes stop_codon:yes gene_type:complete